MVKIWGHSTSSTAANVSEWLGSSLLYAGAFPGMALCVTMRDRRTETLSSSVRQRQRRWQDTTVDAVADTGRLSSNIRHYSAGGSADDGSNNEDDDDDDCETATLLDTRI
ncbi:hypothetical protein GGI07_004108 [Coemansia sp. Benny D115]|nr:hypothetical protein GGI07_004108 [Coemansia sp. Benny D115]